MLRDFRREHPHLKTIIVEDGLASNYTHLSLLDELKLEYITGVKAGDHDYLFNWIKQARGESENVFDFMRAGRARWKIENETFNTLKNQGYNFEHYGHGGKNLCLVMMMLMLLAFLIDQVQFLCCKLRK